MPGYISPTKPSPVYPSSVEVPDRDNPSLLELVLKFVYCDTLPSKADDGNDIPQKDRNMTVMEEQQMKFSIDWWYKAVLKRKEQRIIRFKIKDGDEIDELGHDAVHEALMRFASIIRKKETKDPLLMRRLASFKHGRIDYRKVYSLPGSKRKEDYERARLTLDFWNAKNPDLS